MADETQSTSRRDVIAAGIDALEANQTVGDATSTPAPSIGQSSVTLPPASEGGASTSSAPGRPRDEGGRFTKAGETPAEKKAPAAPAHPPGAAAPPPEPQAKEGAATSTAAPSTAATDSTYKAPQAWKPTARELWAKVPTEVQSEIGRREKEIQAKLSEVAEVRKSAEEFNRVVQPFEAMIRSQGATPAQAVDRLLRTGYTLQHGTPQQKAELAASIIKGYNIPIDVLDAMLAGQQPQGQTSVAADPAQIAAQVRQQIQQDFQHQAQAARAQRYQQRIQAFASKHEFFDDVRARMADILDGRGSRDPSDEELGEVYDLACRIHPEISAVVKQREAAKQAETSQEATRRAQAASSSVRSNPAASPGSPTPKGRREVIEQGIDRLISGGRL